MKMLVVSDSHGDQEVLKRILEVEGEDTQMFFHCGDSLVEYSEMFPFATVKGNCDFFNKFNKHIELDSPIGYIYVLHGEMGLLNIKRMVKQLKYKPDIVLYGHTHIHSYEYHNDVHYFNPGSVSKPRDGTNGTYLIIEGTTKDDIRWEFKKVETLNNTNICRLGVKK